MSLRKVPFTSARVNTLKCPTDVKQVIYWDAKTSNLGLRVTPSQKKAYVFEAWLNGKSLRTTIGDSQTWTIADAQAEARRLKVLVDRGVDPREEKAELRAAVEAKRFKAVSALDVWDEYVKDRSSKWSARHIADHHVMVRLGGEAITRGRRAGMESVKEQGMLRELLNVPLPEITRDRVAHWLKKRKYKASNQSTAGSCITSSFYNLGW